MCSSQEIKEGHLAYYGSLDNISLTNDHRMFIARQLEKQLSSRRTILPQILKDCIKMSKPAYMIFQIIHC